MSLRIELGITMTQTNTRLPWIDVCKGIAILAVVIDHLHSKCYESLTLQMYTAFSVGLFVFIGGINSANSIRHHISSIDRKYIYHRCSQILIPYAVATSIYSFWERNCFFDFMTFLKHLVLFDTTGPFYFVLFYIQLLAVSAILYYLFSASPSFYRKALLLCAFYVFGVICNKYTFILPVHGGGKFLLGGSYLFLFCAGICFDEFLTPRSKKVSVGVFLFASICLVSIVVGRIHTFFEKIPPQLWANPPNIYAIIYILIIFSLIYTASRIFSFIPIRFTRYPIGLFTFIGRYSLYIFLFHMLFIQIAEKINPLHHLPPWLNMNCFAHTFLTWSWLLLMAILPAPIMAMWYEWVKKKMITIAERGTKLGH
jgi:fucose 4-O-acetylase-like acetyltransferase